MPERRPAGHQRLRIGRAALVGLAALGLLLAGCATRPPAPPESGGMAAERARIERARAHEIVLHALALIDTG